MIIIFYILAFIGLKLKIERTKNAKLVSILSWLIVLGFGVIHFIAITESYDPLGVLLASENFIPSIPLLILEFIILLVINVLTIKNKFKAILYTLTQLGTSVVIIVALILIVWGLFTGGGSNVTTSSKHGADEGSYTDTQNQQAKAQGFTNGKDAEMSGRSWNGNDWV